MAATEPLIFAEKYRKRQGTSHLQEGVDGIGAHGEREAVHESFLRRKLNFSCESHIRAGSIPGLFTILKYRTASHE